MTVSVGDLQRTMADTFGFSEFRPGQREVLAALVDRGAALAVFPTGAGKSLCYQLPAIALDGVTLVVSPLIALMKDQIDFLRARGVSAARLDSSLEYNEALSVTDDLRSGKLKLLYVAPERFANERFVATIRRCKVALFAIDEAHCISEWGHNFRPDYLKLAEFARLVNSERILALTATATPAVVSDICSGLRIPPECSVVTGFYRPNLRLLTTASGDNQRTDLLIDRLRSRPPGVSIVYVTLQRTAERVASALSGAGLEARHYHAGMEADERKQVQDWWTASDRAIVVATIAFGMGIDKAAVRYVYHYNLPKSLESYSQEIGRAGRDGLQSVCEMLACPDDVPTLENFAYGDTPTHEALRGLVGDLVCGASDVVEIDLYALSNKHDLRQLVLRTALAYLELMGVIRQGTPFYAGYEVKPLIEVANIVGQFTGEPAKLVSELFRRARKGKIWYYMDPTATADALGQERRRVVRAIDYLQEHGWAEVRAGLLRYPYTRLRESDDPEALAADLARRFDRREALEIGRIAAVVDLVTHDGCQVNSLVGHFGEVRAAPCGHCSFCETGRPCEMPAASSAAPNADDCWVAELEQLRAQHPDALGHWRQAARFLCGLSSPATSRARLGRSGLFGLLDGCRFADVLAACERLT